MSDCIFCKIIAGEIPCAKLYEDEHCIAFLDISPAVKGHALVVPKKHCTDLLDASEDTLAHSSKAIKKVATALIDAVSAEGFNVVQNNGAQAGQIIHHLHFHIIPRFDGDGQDFSWNHLKYGEGELEEYAQSIKKRITNADDVSVL